MRSIVQETLISSLASVLTPIVRWLLRSGIGCSEFVAVAKSVFVDVASEDYGLRGRPTNVSRISSITGISRKEVRRIREQGPIERWTPNMEAAPANMVIHYWHYDPEFCMTPGCARPLPFKGRQSFCDLVRKYAGDIPPGALRTELVRRGAVIEDRDDRLVARRRFFAPGDMNPDLVRYLAFAMHHFGSTIVHNAEVHALGGAMSQTTEPATRFERMAWTETLAPNAIRLFREWTRSEGATFIRKADDWIGEHELPRDRWDQHERHAVGIGVYYFEEDK